MRLTLVTVMRSRIGTYYRADSGGLVLTGVLSRDPHDTPVTLSGTPLWQGFANHLTLTAKLVVIGQNKGQSFLYSLPSRTRQMFVRSDEWGAESGLIHMGSRGNGVGEEQWCRHNLIGIPGDPRIPFRQIACLYHKGSEGLILDRIIHRDLSAWFRGGRNTLGSPEDWGVMPP